MAERSPAVLSWDEHALYPVHEEDTVPEGAAHHYQSVYLTGALRTYLPRCWVIGNLCLYWERGNTERYRAPDLAVIEGPEPDPLPNVYLAWRDAPLLFVAEIASPSTAHEDQGRNRADYEQHLRVPEYLFADLARRELRLWRLVDGEYQPVAPAADGRLWSSTLKVAFGFDASAFLRVYAPSGEPLPTYAEVVERRREAERGRREAERAQLEAERARREADQRAEAEARQRRELERRLAEMAAQMERLRAAPRGEGDPEPE
jgi:Uma2 family endonuclease